MNTVKSLMIALVLFSTSMSFAKTGRMEENKTAEIEVSINEMQGDKVLVCFENYGSEVVRVKIKDLRGRTLYSEKLKEAKVVLKKFDVSKLPAGAYSYEVSTGNYEVSKTIMK